MPGPRSSTSDTREKDIARWCARHLELPVAVQSESRSRIHLLIVPGRRAHGDERAAPRWEGRMAREGSAQSRCVERGGPTPDSPTRRPTPLNISARFG